MNGDRDWQARRHSIASLSTLSTLYTKNTHIRVIMGGACTHEVLHCLPPQIKTNQVIKSFSAYTTYARLLIAFHIACSVCTFMYGRRKRKRTRSRKYRINTCVWRTSRKSWLSFSKTTQRWPRCSKWVIIRTQCFLLWGSRSWSIFKILISTWNISHQHREKMHGSIVSKHQHVNFTQDRNNQHTATNTQQRTRSMDIFDTGVMSCFTHLLEQNKARTLEKMKIAHKNSTRRSKMCKVMGCDIHVAQSLQHDTALVK